MSKGIVHRPCDREKFNANWDAIFKKDTSSSERINKRDTKDSKQETKPKT